MTAVLNTTKLTEIFIECDDFCKKLSQYLLANELESDPSKGLMDDSEMMAIVIFITIRVLNVLSIITNALHKES